jgi:uncharacterized protein YecE (DUF72 family)
MTDEVKRIKYRYLLNSLQTIRAKLKNLEEDSKDLYAYTNSNIKIDGECIVKDEFEDIKNNFTNIKSELREKLMFNVSKKI